jgi:hypothetical protein
LFEYALAIVWIASILSGAASLTHLMRAGRAAAEELRIFSDAKKRVSPRRISETCSTYYANPPPSSSIKTVSI